MSKMPQRRRERDYDCENSNRLNKQNNNSALKACFSVHFFAVAVPLQLYNLKMPNFTFLKEKNERRRNFLSLSQLAYDWKEFGSSKRIGIIAIEIERT